MSGLSGRAVVAGIGATDFSKDSGRSELRLASEAVRDALDDWKAGRAGDQRPRQQRVSTTRSPREWTRSWCRCGPS